MPQDPRIRQTRTRPFSPEALSAWGELAGFSPPGPFEPEGEWRHTYEILLAGRGRRGYLTVARATGPGGGARLEVEQALRQAAGATWCTRATLDCSADPISSPRAWSLESVVLRADAPLDVATVREEGAVTEGVLRVTAQGRTRERPLGNPFTSDWSLFDAVQRLPRKDTESLSFDLLERLDLLKPDQRLGYRREEQLELDGGVLPLTGYQQIGRGLLPVQYWVDEHCRLLLVMTGPRAYIWAPTAREDFGEAET